MLGGVGILAFATLPSTPWTNSRSGGKNYHSPNTACAKLIARKGSAKYKPDNNAIVGKIRRFAGMKETQLTVDIGLSSLVMLMPGKPRQQPRQAHHIHVFWDLRDALCVMPFDLRDSLCVMPFAWCPLRDPVVWGNLLPEHGDQSCTQESVQETALSSAGVKWIAYHAILSLHLISVN